MKLKQGESIIKIIHHHPFPFFMQLIKILIASIPFFFIPFLLSSILTKTQFIIANLIIIGLFMVVIFYLSLIYWLDKIIITNKRIVHIDWIQLTIRREGEVLIDDIQDIYTEERGILAVFYLFDYGFLRIETASGKSTIRFTEAPNPEFVKRFLSDHIKEHRVPSTFPTPLVSQPSSNIV
jgi:uncharacterized membrane protein YdbT with pleckstrin-like domain